jgi:signal peptidase I
MKKLIGMLIFLFLIFSCNKILKNDKATQIIKSDSTLINKKNEATIFLYDDSQDTVKTNTFLLKNNFKLISYSDKGENDNEITFKLIGKKIDTIVMNEPISNRKYTHYFDNTDFDNYFAIKQSSGNNVHFWLIDKLTGKECFDGLQVQFDFINNVIIYADEDDNYKLFLYDLNLKRKISIIIPYRELAKYDCIKYNDLWKSIYLKKKSNSFYSFGFKICDSIVSFNQIR